MIKGSEVRHADFPIEPMLLDRWSPRAMSSESISPDELMRLFEAARWAPSSFNAQQWRALYAHRDTQHWELFLNLLGEGNKTWAKNAAVLVVFISRTKFEYNEKIFTNSFLRQWCGLGKLRTPRLPAESCRSRNGRFRKKRIGPTFPRLC
jgi:nitroreductase